VIAVVIGGVLIVLGTAARIRLMIQARRERARTADHREE
jgi:hypothetical protein